MDGVEELLRSARYAPVVTGDGLADVTRRGRRRRLRTRAATVATASALCAGVVVATSVATSPGPHVVTPAPAATPTPSYVALPTETRWHAAHLSTDGRTLTVTFSGGNPDPEGNCYVRMRARAEETAETVTIRLETLVLPEELGTTRRCHLRLYSRSESVTLDAPLGDRRVIDAVDGGDRAVLR